MLAVLDADELNAFAVGGHLLVVSSYAVKRLDEVELEGVLAHELAHHLGMHTVALTISQWMSIPILLLAQVGFFLQNVARAATDAFASNSMALTIVGRFIGTLLTAVGWVFLAGVLGANLLGNWVGRASEFQADQRAVEMGFGRQLSAALRLVAGHQRATTAGVASAAVRDASAGAHPRRAIDAMLRARARPGSPADIVTSSVGRRMSTDPTSSPRCWPPPAAIRPARTPVWFMRQAGRSLPEYRAVRGEGSILGAIAKPTSPPRSPCSRCAATASTRP